MTVIFYQNNRYNYDQNDRCMTNGCMINQFTTKMTVMDQKDRYLKGTSMPKMTVVQKRKITVTLV